MADSLPPPLVQAEVDLRDFGFMPLDVLRLRDSDLAALATGDEFKAAVLLWCVAWHQVPAASLPDDDRLLARYTGTGPGWKKVRDEALRGFVKCSDGRLYHATIAEKASEAWNSKQAQRARTAAATAAREAKRKAEHESRDAHRNDSRDDQRDVARDVVQGIGTVKGQGDKRNTPPSPQEGAISPVTLKTWLQAVKSKGEKAIPDGDPVFAYAEQVGIPTEFLELAWLAFRHRYTKAEGTCTKRYKDWRKVFLNAVRGNWLKLWWVQGDVYALTTVGVQAQREHGQKGAA